MSFRKNVVANYASQIYSTLAGIAIVPLYLKYMGAEAYGLVGFFAMLQAWFGLLDIGLSPTVARATARARAGAIEVIDFRRLVRALTVIFVLVAVCGSSVLFLSAPFIADQWLHVETLPSDEVRRAVQLMALGVGLRWLSGLSRARITGAEEIIWLSGFNAFIATIRFAGVMPIFFLVDTKPDTFFAFQFIVAAVELGILKLKAHSLLPQITSSEKIGWSLRPILDVLKFSLAIALTSSVWILVTQMDKLVLSKLLPLQSYGYYSLAVVIAGSVLIATGPISMVLIPRLTSLAATGDEAGLLHIYSRATRIVSVIAFPVAFVLAAFARPVVWAWTGDAEAAQEIAPVLQLYALGNAVMAVSAFPAYLQYAYGNLRFHLMGSALFVLVLLPALTIGVWRFGALGAGWAWLGTNVLYLIFWVPVVHRKLVPGTHLRWISCDVLVATSIAAGGTALIKLLSNLPQLNRVEAGLFPLCAGLAILLVTALPLLWGEISSAKKLRTNI